MNIKVLDITILLIVIFLLILLVTNNINELYQPRLEVTTKDGKRALILWYNHVTDKSITREYKVLIKLLQEMK